MKKRLGLLFLVLTILCAVTVCSPAEGVITETMRVVNCKDWVSLRELPAQNSERLKQVPLGAFVYNCVKDQKGFAKCEYEGQTGYILYKYLEPLSMDDSGDAGESILMTMEDLESGDVVLDWKEYNIRVMAVREFPGENGAENLRIGCFIDKEPIWGLKKTLKHKGSEPLMSAFIGGRAQDPQVMLYSMASGLSMIDLLTGKTLWTVPAGQALSGGIGAFAAGDDGVLYVAAADGKKLTAISAKGEVLWQTEIADKSLSAPEEIRLNLDEIEIRYTNGKLAYLEYIGQLVGVYDEKPETAVYQGDADEGFEDGFETP